MQQCVCSRLISSFPVIGMLFPSFPSEPQNPAMVFNIHFLTDADFLCLRIPALFLIAGKYKVMEKEITGANIRSRRGVEHQFNGPA